MSELLNLLPLAYRQARRHERRVRAGLLVGGILLTTEAAVGVLLHLRAEQTRELLADAAAARRATTSLKKESEAPAERLTQLERQVTLAERLRTKHRWSRLLSAVARATPDNVTLSTVRTDPPQWTPGLQKSVLAAAAAGNKDQSRLLSGVLVAGHAADHKDLSTFMANLQASGVFAALDLKQAKREPFLNQDAVSFELLCRW